MVSNSISYNEYIPLIFYKADGIYINKIPKLEIKHVIYNPPATIIQWSDETKTVVKATDNDSYNPVFGVLMAYYQKHSEMTKTQVGKFCDNILKECDKQQEKKNKIKNEKITDLCIADDEDGTCVHKKTICCFSCNSLVKCKESDDVCSMSSCKKYKSEYKNTEN